MVKKWVMVLALIAAVPWFLSSAALSWKEMRAVGKAPLERHTITVTADEKVVVAPDLAVINVGIMTEGQSIAEIQKENTRKFNELLSQIKTIGVAEADIKTTNYSIQPRYDWTTGRQRLLGYTVSQNVEVKVRDLSKAGDVLQVSGLSGANQVSGIEFRVDNTDKYLAEAREKAVAEAKEKAVVMARQAGFKLGKVVNFSEGGYAPTPYPVMYKSLEAGMGGDAAAPSIQPGTTDIVSNVSLTYEIE